MAFRDWLASRVRWDTTIACQRLRNPVFDLWFSHFPLLGNEIMYVLVTPALCWFVDPGVARRFTLVATVACYPCNATKDIMRLPRPPPRLHVRGAKEVVAQQYGFPSGHSAINLATAVVLAMEALAAGVATPTIIVALALFHVVHVCFSRLYMGVHSAADIIGGLTIGTLVLAAFVAGGFVADAASVQHGFGGYACALALSVAGLSLYPDKRSENTAFTEVVAFAGLHIGATLGSGPLAAVAPMRGSGADLSGGAARIVALFVLGLVALGLVRTGASAAFKLVLPRVLPKEASEICRKYIVTALAALWVATPALHPADLFAALL